jgi:hypothetical protein
MERKVERGDEVRCRHHDYGEQRWDKKIIFK